MKQILPPTDPVVVYQTEDGLLRVDVRMDGDTVWLSQEQISLLFERERSVITKHIRNALAEGELVRDSVCANFAHTAADGKTYRVEHYNLDVIISVGYRVKSQRGTQFRMWARRLKRINLKSQSLVQFFVQCRHASHHLFRSPQQSRLALRPCGVG